MGFALYWRTVDYKFLIGISYSGLFSSIVQTVGWLDLVGWIVAVEVV